MLTLLSAEGSAAIRLVCPRGGKRLLVNVPDFRPIGSEERLSFGANGESVALVADTRGDAQRGGVTATGAVPATLATLLGGSLSASYGAQKTGPHPAPPQVLAHGFAAACGPEPHAAEQPGTPIGSAAGSTATGQAQWASACLMQGSEHLRVTPLRAVGTEPFWGARIEGRCVTYSNPDDQQGTRVWTRYTQSARGGGIWSGMLGGHPFEFRTRAAPGCSDGMSDKKYPLAVELKVQGERRKGCAEPV